MKVHPLRSIWDERGSFTTLLRADWKDVLDQDQIAQTNFSASYPDMIRAWHRHARGQVDYFVVLKGSLKICAYDSGTQELDEVVSAGENLQIVRIPGHYWHGFRVLGTKRAFLIYFTTSLYDDRKPDEERRPWNDPTIVPKLLNGKADDPRVGRPWDWQAVPYR